MLRRTLILLACCFATASLQGADPLPGTTPLTWEDDIASRMIDGIDKFLLREIAQSVADRSKHWKRDFTSAESYNKSVQPNRDRLSISWVFVISANLLTELNTLVLPVSQRSWDVEKATRSFMFAGRPSAICTVKDCCWSQASPTELISWPSRMRIRHLK